LPMKISGAIEGLVIDVGLLEEGKFPITALRSVAVSVEGNLFGGEFTGSLLAGIVPFDASGNAIPDSDLTTEAVDRVFFVGLEGGFSMAGIGGFTIRLGLSELGPLGVLITASVPGGILIDPTGITGLSLNDFVGGIEFFKSLPSITEPDQLRMPEFSVSPALDASTWLTTTKQQVIKQYQAVQADPSRGGFLAAFTSPMLITAGCKIFSQYTSEFMFNGQVQVKLSTDGKFLAVGKLNTFGGALSTTARMYMDISQIAKGNARVLFLADIPDQAQLLVIKGKLEMSFGLTTPVVVAGSPPVVDKPVASLVDPASGDTVGVNGLKTRGYVDVTFDTKEGTGLDASSVTDAGAELRLHLPDGTTIDLPGAATRPDGFTDSNRYRYTLPSTV
ncbi:MAG TPA: hypothetical protein PLV92_27525, partial [Pirellulaceae bacterium]|nr:hypothetical protein [Pirellulaceae bacterium]